MDTIQEELKNNHKIKIWATIAFLIAMTIMFVAYFDVLMYVALMLVDVDDLDFGLRLLFQTIDIKVGLIIFPPIFFFIGISKYGKNVKYIKRYYSYKQLQQILKDEVFEMHKTFYNKEEFFYSKNWLYIDEVLIPRFLIKEIKVKQGTTQNKICIYLKSNEVYEYNPRNKSKLFLDMAKMIDMEFKNSNEDIIEYFEPINHNKTFKILNHIGVITSFVGILGFFILENIVNYSIPSNFFYIAKTIALIIWISGFVENIISIIKKQDEQKVWISFTINIICLLLIMTLLICFRFIYISSYFQY